MAAGVHPTAAATHVTVIEAGARQPLVDFAELWRFRELLGFLAWRDVRVRYRQTLLGAGWALLEPLAGAALYTLLFHGLAGFEAGETPYPLFCYAGVLLWTFFARSLRAATVSLVSNSALVTKAYFPRLLLPVAGQIAMLVDLACALLMFLALAAYFGVPLTWHIVTAPLWVALAVLNALGIGLIFAAINVRFRDVSQAVPFATQMWMFLTPVAYPLHQIPERWLGLYVLNPMVGVVEGMRWALLPEHAFDPLTLLPSVLVGSLLLLLGLLVFRRTERRFADIV